MAETIVGTGHGVTTAEWSTNNVAAPATGTYGVVIGLSIVNGAQREPIPKNNGGTYGVIFYDETDEVELEIVSKNGATLPAQGDALTVTEGTGGGAVSTVIRVTEVGRTYAYRQLKKFRIRGTKWAELGA